MRGRNDNRDYHGQGGHYRDRDHLGDYHDNRDRNDQHSRHAGDFRGH
jgi:hypothetical protein